MSTLEIDHLTKRFGHTVALNELSFTVPPGSLYGFVGSNGAGKSTCMRIALGVLEADSGEVRVDGQPITDTARRRIGYMPEERGLYKNEKVGDQLVYLTRLHGLDKQAANSNVDALLERLGIAERKNTKLTELSLGNQQRVQLAVALSHEPQILVLDEPFSGLDPVAVDVMADLLREYAAKGCPVLFSSHQLDLVQRLCDRVVIITKGTKRAEGTVDELRDSGPVTFHVDCAVDPAQWAPADCRVRDWNPAGGVALVEAASADRDQEVLHAALSAGPVHSFYRRRPDLTELFREAVDI